VKGKETMDDEVKKCQLMVGFVSHFAEMSGNRYVKKAMTVLHLYRKASINEHGKEL